MPGENIFFDGWTGLIRTAVVGICAYTALLVLTRISGKRTLSKMNAFDLIVTVALGSTLATIFLSKDAALAEGVLALGLLIFLQFSITWLSVRSATVSRLVKAEPRLLFHKGEFLQSAMKTERVNKDELLQAMRSQGVSRLEQVEAVVLETDGSFSVVEKAGDGKSTVLPNVSKDGNS
ncbi:MAG TPA: YetF domain-containing protein [Anaerolineales bacterium]|nr:YetF domain-containing protein [Anaerolineales bacterium]